MKIVAINPKSFEYFDEIFIYFHINIIILINIIIIINVL